MEQLSQKHVYEEIICNIFCEIYAAENNS